MHKQSGKLISLTFGAKAGAAFYSPVPVNGKLRANLRAAIDSDNLFDTHIHTAKTNSAQVRKDA